MQHNQKNNNLHFLLVFTIFLLPLQRTENLYPSHRASYFFEFLKKIMPMAKKFFLVILFLKILESLVTLSVSTTDIERIIAVINLVKDLLDLLDLLGFRI